MPDAKRSPIEEKSRRTCQRPDCRRVVSRHQDLQRHMTDVHEESKKCSYPGCGYVVKRMSRLRDHFKKEHNLSMIEADGLARLKVDIAGSSIPFDKTDIHSQNLPPLLATLSDGTNENNVDASSLQSHHAAAQMSSSPVEHSPDAIFCGIHESQATQSFTEMLFGTWNVEENVDYLEVPKTESVDEKKDGP